MTPCPIKESLEHSQERKFNKTRDFLEVCSPLGVTHVLALFSTETSLNLKLMKVPQVMNRGHILLMGLRLLFWGIRGPRFHSR